MIFYHIFTEILSIKHDFLQFHLLIRTRDFHKLEACIYKLLEAYFNLRCPLLSIGL